MQFIPFEQIVGPTYTLSNFNAECQRCVNMYLEKVESGDGKSKYWLKPTPGLLLVTDIAELKIQTMYTASNGRCFVICGTGLYELFSDNTVTQLGTFGDIPTGARCIDNGLILFIIFGSSSYSLNLNTNVFTQITDPRYEGGTSIAFLNQYFIVNVPNSQFYQISPLAYDGTQPWSAIDKFAAESSPDNITSLVVNGSELWLFGPNGYEVHFNSGDPILPFQRIANASSNVGTCAPNSVLSLNGSVVWLGGSKEGKGIVWVSNGYQPSRISNHGIENIISSLSETGDAVAWSYLLNGHYFYVLNFPTARKTLVYDMATQMWHEMEYRQANTNTRTQHRGICQTFAFNKNLVGDYASGRIYELSDTTYTDDNVPIIRYRRSPNNSAAQRLLYYHKWELIVSTGVGLSSGQGSDPVIFVRWSDDYAHNWSNYHTKAIGKIGEFAKRVIFTRLGAAINRVWEVQISDPVPFAIMASEFGLNMGVH